MTSKMAIISTLITDQNQGTNENRIYHTLLYRTAEEKKPRKVLLEEPSFARVQKA